MVFTKIQIIFKIRHIILNLTVVYMKLPKNVEEVYYHSVKKECDFVIKQGLDIVEAIQVAYQINVSNREREYQGLQEAMHTYNLREGLLLSFNIEECFIPDTVGMKVLPVWEWLLTDHNTITL